MGRSNDNETDAKASVPPPQRDVDSKKPPAIVSALSGAISGTLISACVQPLDVVRTTMQGDAAKGVYRSTVATVMAVVKSHGIAGLWKGTQPSVLRVGLGAAVHFVVLEHMKGALLHLSACKDKSSSNEKPVLSPLGAAVSGVTVVKTRMEYPCSDPNAVIYRNTFHALSSIWRAEGPQGLFRGLMPTILTNAPFSGLYYMFYTQLKQRVSREDRPQVLVNFGCGCVAAVGATLLTQPADVVRTHMQLGLVAGGGASAAARLGSLATLQAALNQHGLAALLIGATPRMLKRTAQTALLWTLYEELVPRVTQVVQAVSGAGEKNSASSSSSSSNDMSGSSTGSSSVQATGSQRKAQEQALPNKHTPLSQWTQPLDASLECNAGGRTAADKR